MKVRLEFVCHHHTAAVGVCLKVKGLWKSVEELLSCGVMFFQSVHSVDDVVLLSLLIFYQSLFYCWLCYCVLIIFGFVGHLCASSAAATFL